MIIVVTVVMNSIMYSVFGTIIVISTIIVVMVLIMAIAIIAVMVANHADTCNGGYSGASGGDCRLFHCLADWQGNRISVAKLDTAHDNGPSGSVGPGHMP